MNKTYSRVKLSSGFSLIELLVVVIILGMLAGIVAPNVMSRLGGAKSKTARVQIEEFGAALDLYFLETGSYPTTDIGMNALFKQPAGIETWNGPYLKKSKIPPDPWGNPYHYESPGKQGAYDLYSLGADNAEDGEGDDGDINSWE